MKKLIVILVVCFASIVTSAQDFYYYKNEKLELERNTQYLYVLCNLDSKEKLNEQIKDIGQVTDLGRDIYHKRLIKTYANVPDYMFSEQNHFAEIKLNNDHLSKEELQRILSDLKNNASILNASYHYSYKGGNHFAITNYFWVQVKEENQISLLIEEANKINYSVIGQNPFMKDWVMLGANKNATLYPLQASQEFHKNKLFRCAEPDMMSTAQPTCVNDPLFNTQWGLRNTAQYGGVIGNDINACGVWKHTTGSTNVDIAIVDNGFENNHPDLDNNLENTGYSGVTGTTPTVVYGSHGTACAGISAAEGNNNLGVVGVAYGCQLMSSSIAFAKDSVPGIPGGATNAQFADAIGWARVNGAEVISNSWGGGSPNAIIDASIGLALTTGRNGLGCVVLFSTGNDTSSSLAYPSNSNTNIIAVGNLTTNAARAVSSNYGTGMDVMAPGTWISTTDRQGSNGYNVASGVTGNYNTASFNGTSAACPFVAGVAALVLSVNPCLTQFQVATIINRSARKIAGYSYFFSGVDGSWNAETGYGLVDAQAAVEMAMAGYLQNQTITGVANYLTKPIIQAGHHVNLFITQGNFNTTTTANVTINCSHFIEFKEGCDIQGIMDAHIGTVGSCTTW